MSEKVIITGTLERVGKQITSINDGIKKLSGIFLPFEGKINYGINITYLIIIIYIFGSQLNFCFLIGHLKQKEEEKKKNPEEPGEGMIKYTILILLWFLILIHGVTVFYKIVAVVRNGKGQLNGGGFVGKGLGWAAKTLIPAGSKISGGNLTNYITISDKEFAGIESIVVSTICLFFLVLSFIILSDDIKKHFFWIRVVVTIYMLLHTYSAYKELK